MADVLILFSVLLLAAGTIPAPPPEVLPSTPPESSSTEIGCADELVAFSPCLPYISEPPNNISDSPPVQCCDNLAAAFGDDTAICLCYLFHNPEILGFPINSVKLLSLTSVCPVTEKQGQGQANFSLESLCSGETMLPPFRSVTANLRGSGSSPRSPTPPSPRSPMPPSPAPRPPGDLDIPLPQEPPGSGSLSPPPPSDVDDDHPSPDAQATKSCSAAIPIMYNCWLWVLSSMSILLYTSCKHATR